MSSEGNEIKETASQETFATLIEEIFHKRSQFVRAAFPGWMPNVPHFPFLTLCDSAGGEDNLVIPIPLQDPFFSLVKPHLRAIPHPAGGSEPSHSWQLPADCFRLDGEHWNGALEEEANQVLHSMGVSEYKKRRRKFLKPVAQQLLIQTEGCQHLPDLDFNLPDSYGTLLIQLPSIFEGGEISSPTEIIDYCTKLPSCDKRRQYFYIAFLSGLQLEMTPLTKGTRVLVAYSLQSIETPPKQTIPTALSAKAFKLQIEQAISLYNKEVICLQLSSTYQEGDGDVGISRLKGADLTFACELERLRKQNDAPFQLILSLATRKIKVRSKRRESSEEPSFGVTSTKTDGKPLRYVFFQDFYELAWKNAMYDPREYAYRMTTRTSTMLVIAPQGDGYPKKFLEEGQETAWKELLTLVKNGSLTKTQAAEHLLLCLELGSSMVIPRHSEEIDNWGIMFDLVEMLGDRHVASCFFAMVKDRLLPKDWACDQDKSSQPTCFPRKDCQGTQSRSNLLKILPLLDWSDEHFLQWVGALFAWHHIRAEEFVFQMIPPVPTPQQHRALQYWAEEWQRDFLANLPRDFARIHPCLMMCSVSSAPSEFASRCFPHLLEKQSISGELLLTIDRSIMAVPGWARLFREFRLDNLRRLAEVLCSVHCKADHLRDFLSILDGFQEREEIAAPVIAFLLKDIDIKKRQEVLVQCPHLTGPYIEALVRRQLCSLREYHRVTRIMPPRMPALLECEQPCANEIESFLRSTSESAIINGKWPQGTIRGIGFAATPWGGNEKQSQLMKTPLDKYSRHEVAATAALWYSRMHSLYPHVEEDHPPRQ